ncbi:MAG TPA: DUF3592 domain-containing protein [Schlesneria sp.]
MPKSKTPKKPSVLGFGCAAFFAIPFASVGLFMGYEIIRTFVEHQAMQRWIQTPAVITKADLQVQHDEGATYKAIAEYQYEFDGQKRQGSRVSLSTGSDNVGNFHQRVHAELKAHQTNGQPFRCFVNPAQPDQSILYRDLRWEMIAFYDLFVLIFGGFGLGVLVGCIVVGRTERRRSALAVEYPDQPWFWRDDWAANEIEVTSKHWFFAMAVFALFWNVMTAPLWWLLPPQIARGNLSALWAMPLPVIGAILIVVSIRMLLRDRKYGRCVFRMTTPKGVIGSELSGVIETSRPVECDQFQVLLLCQNKVSDGEDTKLHEVLRREQSVSNQQTDTWGDGGTSIPVRFEVPASSRPTGEADDGTIQWTLRATSEDPSIRFKVEFQVPVFRPSEPK